MPTASFVQEKSPKRFWEKRVLYAYLRMMGATQKDAGNAVGRTERVVQQWEYDPKSWALAREEARKRWLSELMDASRVTLLKTIKEGHGVLAMQVLERTDYELAPHQHKELDSQDVKAMQEARRAVATGLKARLADIAARHQRAGGRDEPLPA